MELLRKTISEVTPLDPAAMRAAEAHIHNLTMPTWALGRLCDLGVRLSGIAGKMPPPVDRRTIVVMAGVHGVVAEGVSPQRSKVTQQMVANMAAGGAGVNVLARQNDTRVLLADFGMLERDEELVRQGKLIDCNVGKGTANMAKEPAMSRDDAVRALENGIALTHRLADETDVFGTGEMGIGNTTPATAIAAVLTGQSPEMLIGPGAGLPREAMGHKLQVIKNVLEMHRPDPADAIDILSKVGGYEIGGIAGLVLGAASRRRPVLVDGFISTSGAMLACALCPEAKSYVILAHASAEPGHAMMCEWLMQRPLLTLEMRLGEGTGAAMAVNIVTAAQRILTEMSTFGGAGVEVEGIHRPLECG